MWTGFDYRGEPSPNGWPNISSQYGIIDMCGFPKDTFFYYQSWWTEKPVLHLFPHWNWPGYEGKKIAVWVYSNLDKVELFHNGQSLGAKDVKKDAHVAWNVEYAPGSIEARGWKDGKQVMTARRDTTGAAAKLVLRPDRDSLSADGEDVAMFAVEVQDANGRTVPDHRQPGYVQCHRAGANSSAWATETPPTNRPTKALRAKPSRDTAWRWSRRKRLPAPSRWRPHAPGLTGRIATVSSKQIELRPQVGIWQRPIPKGAGITGLWIATSDPATGLRPRFLGSPRIFTLTQEGGKLTGTVEGPGGWFGGDDAPAAIVTASFRAIMCRSNPASMSSTAKSREGSLSSSAPSTSRSACPRQRSRTPTRRSSALRPTAPILPFDLSDFASAGSSMSVVLKRSER